MKSEERKERQVPLFYESYGEPAHNAAPVGLVAEFALKAGAECPEVEWLFLEGVFVANPHHVPAKEVLH
jgi:hypothetical protein